MRLDRRRRMVTMNKNEKKNAVGIAVDNAYAILIFTTFLAGEKYSKNSPLLYRCWDFEKSHDPPSSVLAETYGRREVESCLLSSNSNRGRKRNL